MPNPQPIVDILNTVYEPLGSKLSRAGKLMSGSKSPRPDEVLISNIGRVMQMFGDSAQAGYSDTDLLLDATPWGKLLGPSAKALGGALAASATTKGTRHVLEALGKLVRVEKPALETFLHGTDAKTAERILAEGALKAPSERAGRKYSYSQFGPSSVYGSREGSWWFKDPHSGRAIDYESTIPFTLSHDARVIKVNTAKDLERLATKAGFDSSDDMMEQLFVDFDVSDSLKSSEAALAKLKRVTDVLDIGSPGQIASDQIVVLDPSVAKPKKLATE